MYTLEDTVQDYAKHWEIDLHRKFNYFGKHTIVNNVKKYGRLIIKRLRTDKKLNYSYQNQRIICDIFLLCIYNANCEFFKNGLSVRIQNIILDNMCNKLFELLKDTNDINAGFENFYDLTRTIMNNSARCQRKNDLYEKFENLIIKIYNTLSPVILPKSNNYERDVIRIELGEDIEKVNIPENGYLVDKKIKELKNNLINQLGYILPVIHTRDDSNIPNNGYRILIRNDVVSQGTFDYKDSKFFDLIFAELREIVLRYVHKIFSVKDTYSYLEYVKKEYDSEIVKRLLNRLDINDIKKVLCNLIQNGIPINDLPYIIENLAVFARYDKDADSLTEKMKSIMRLVKI